MTKDETVEDFLARGGKIYYARHGESAYDFKSSGPVHLNLDARKRDATPHPKRGKNGRSPSN